MVKIETSVGELLDKISILKIKKEKIVIKSKLNNIQKELESLLEIAEPLKDIDPDQFSNFMGQLIDINLNLWETEDRIRLLEKSQSFDKHFIELARNVYFTNDKRFDKKSEITWIIDPIDGTKSYMSGRPLLGTMIGLLKNNKPIIGMVDFPELDQLWIGYMDKLILNGNDCNLDFISRGTSLPCIIPILLII